MGEEPNKPIDQLLRRYAQARRNGFSPTMSARTRAALQREVDQMQPNPAEVSNGGWRRFWPRFGFAALAAFTLSIFFFTTPKRETQLASGQNASRQNEYFTRTNAPTPHVENQPATPLQMRSAPDDAGIVTDRSVSRPFGIELADKDLKKRDRSKAEQLEERATASPPPDLAKATTQAPALAQRFETKSGQDAVALAPSSVQIAKQLNGRGYAKESLADSNSTDLKAARSGPEAETVKLKDARENQLGRAPMGEIQTLAAVASIPPIARELGLENLGNAVKHTFVSVKTSATQPLLNAFQFEQIGDTLRIIEKDGSVYLGNLQSTNSGVADAAASAFGPDPGTLNFSSDDLKSQTPPRTQVYNFEAAGTNRTLSKQVRMTGSYTINPRIERAPKRGAIEKSVPINPTKPALPPGPKARIDAMAVIAGATNQLKIQAYSQGP